MLLKCFIQYISKFGKVSNGHRTGLVSFHCNPKEGQCQRKFKLSYNCTHFTFQQDNAQNPSIQASKYKNQEFPDVQTEFIKGRGTSDQIANIHWVIEKARELQENYFFFFDYNKAFTVQITTNCGKFLKRWENKTTLLAS